MPFCFVNEDITKIAADAVVCPTDSIFSGSGGADEDIHKAAGKELDDACAALGFLEPGKAVITSGFGLPAKHIIHTQGPVWTGGDTGERETLYDCYMNSLRLAAENGCGSVALPLVSSGTFGFPMDEDIKITQKAVTDFLLESDGDIFVSILVHDKKAIKAALKIDANFKYDRGSDAFPDECLDMASEEIHPEPSDLKLGRSISNNSINIKSFKKRIAPEDYMSGAMASVCKESVCESRFEFDTSYKSFAETLFSFIDEKKLTDVQAYVNSNISRRQFSKIRSDPEYHPKKETVFAFIIGLGLSMEEAEKLLQSAGYAFCYYGLSGKLDQAVRFLIENRMYDIMEANAWLFENDLRGLGEGY